MLICTKVFFFGRGCFHRSAFLILLLAGVSLAAAQPEPLQKIDSRLKRDAGLATSEMAQAVQARAAQPDAKIAPMALPRQAGNYHVQVRVDRFDEAVRQQLQSAGLEIEAAFRGLLSGYVHPKNLETLARVSAVTTIAPEYPPILNAVQGEGPAALRIVQDNERVIPFDGSGIKVGILSDSFAAVSEATPSISDIDGDGIAEVLATDSQRDGDVPAVVELLSDINDDSVSDEGRAMAEIIHEVAPGSELAFASAFLSKASFASQIVELAEIGCQVIVDDVGYFASPIYQDGIVSQAVTEVVENHDAVYLTSFGNAGRHALESQYFDSNPNAQDGLTAKFPTGNDFHEWLPNDAGNQVFVPIDIAADTEVFFILKWQNPYSGMLGPGASTDYDLYIFSQDGSETGPAPQTLIEFSNNYQGTAETPQGDAVEITRIKTLDARQTVYLTVNKHHGEAVPFHLHILARGNFSVPEWVMRGNSLAAYGQPLSPDALGVASVNAMEALSHGEEQIHPHRIDPAHYSSHGGLIERFYSPSGAPLDPPLRYLKPDVTSIDGVRTSFFGREVENRGFVFYGTSAASPQLAGVVALMRQANPALSAREVMEQVKLAATDVNLPGWDALTGDGLTYADDAVDYALSPRDSDEPDDEDRAGLAAGSVIVTDDLWTLDDLSGGRDADPANGRLLAIQWNLPLGNVVDYHVYVEASGGAMQYLGRSGNAFTQTFEWAPNAERVARAFAEGPQFGQSYRFLIYAIRNGQPPLGPYPASGVVLFEQNS